MREIEHYFHTDKEDPVREDRLEIVHQAINSTDHELHIYSSGGENRLIPRLFWLIK